MKALISLALLIVAIFASNAMAVGSSYQAWLDKWHSEQAREQAVDNEFRQLERDASKTFANKAVPGPSADWGIAAGSGGNSPAPRSGRP